MSVRQLPEPWERHADKGAELEAKGDEHQWAAAEQYAEAAKDATYRAIATRVDKDVAHIYRCVLTWVNKSRAEDEGWSFTQAYAKAKRREQPEPAPPPPLPEGTFDVLLADPPWQYDFAETASRQIENQYPTRDVEWIAALEPPSAPNAVLYLWATAPKLREALQVMEAWGFRYVTDLVWVKDKIGMGYWARGRHELLLVGTKGEPGAPEPADRPDSVIEAPRGKHSAKPAVVYELIETAMPDRAYLELFARTERDGWTSWGNEL